MARQELARGSRFAEDGVRRGQAALQARGLKITPTDRLNSTTPEGSRGRAGEVGRRVVSRRFQARGGINGGSSRSDF